MFLLAQFTPDGSNNERTCDVTYGPRTEITCNLPLDGRYRVNVFANTAAHGSFHHVASFSANNDL